MVHRIRSMIMKKMFLLTFILSSSLFAQGEFLNGKNQEVQDLAEQRRQSFMAEKKVGDLVCSYHSGEMLISQYKGENGCIEEMRSDSGKYLTVIGWRVGFGCGSCGVR